MQRLVLVSSLSFCTLISAGCGDNVAPEQTEDSSPLIGVTAQLLPSAAVYVRSGSHANTNFGTATVLQVQDSSTANDDRRSFLKYALTGLNATAVTRATLKINVNELPDGAPVPLTVRSVAGDSWTQTGLKWNNQPASGAVLGSASVAATGLVSFDITSFISQENGGDKIASVVLADETQACKLLKFNSATLDLVINTPPVCGDASCNGSETCSTCPGDCGSCPSGYCGDNICNTANESCSSCLHDCGSCAPVCDPSVCESNGPDWFTDYDVCLEGGAYYCVRKQMCCGGTVRCSNSVGYCWKRV